MSADEPQPVPGDLDAVDAELDAVDRALARLDEGTYGRCVECGAPIDEAELSERPLLETCGRHERGVAATATGPAVDDPAGTVGTATDDTSTSGPVAPTPTVGAPESSGTAQTAWGSGGVASN